MNLSTIDIAIFISYVLLVIFLGYWVSREKKGHEKNAKDYFLASKSLPWWAIGASLIASNISAEQFIGMSGSGFDIGLAIASYEWMAAATLLIVAKFFLPIFLKKGIYTMPQFLEQRFDSRVRTSLAIFWIGLYIFVNLTSVLYLTALALKEIIGIELEIAIIGLALFAVAYSIYGGLKAVAWVDVLQVTFLIGGGLVTTYIALNAVSNGEGVFEGLKVLYQKAPEKFDMIFTKEHRAYEYLPGISVLLGGMWIANLNYWGCNQYIIQRALAAKSINEAQKGIAFAGYLKIILPLVVVIPGIVAFILKADIAKPDEAYPWLLNTFTGPGIKGLAFAALIAAAVSSLSSMMNSASTIFTMDLYQPYFKKDASQKNLVSVGRITGVVAVFIACLVAPQLASLEQTFQYIQKFTGWVSPGVVAIFLFGLFWKKTTANAALWGAISSIVFSAILYITVDDKTLPFLDKMGITFIITSLIIIGISLLERKKFGKEQEPSSYDKSIFQTSPTFNVASVGILVILAAIYAVFW